MSNESDASKADSASAETNRGLSDRFVTFVAVGLLAAICVICWWLATRAAVPGALGAPLG